MEREYVSENNEKNYLFDVTINKKTFIYISLDKVYLDKADGTEDILVGRVKNYHVTLNHKIFIRTFEERHSSEGVLLGETYLIF